MKQFWNYIVEQYQKNYNKPEIEVQKEWEDFFSEIFGYKKIFGEINPHKIIQIGATKKVIPDIIISKNGQDLFDVELKQYNLPFTFDMENQLKSYMALLHISVGILICQKLYIYVCDKDKLKKLEISFEKDNPDGIKFIELFSRDNYSREDVEEFIDGKKLEIKNVQDIRAQINAELTIDLLKDYFSGEYKIEEIEKALEIFDITIDKKEKNSSGFIPVPQFSKTKNVEPVEEKDAFLETDDTPDFIIIKTTPTRLAQVNNDLYYAVRYCWRVKLETVQKYKYVLGVVEGFVREVYEVECWKLVNDGRGRYEFYGHKAPQEIASQFINMKIPSRFRKQGLASPVLYSRMGK